MTICVHQIMWQNPGASMNNRWQRLKDDDSNSSVTSEPLIEDKEVDQTVSPNFHLFILSFFNSVKHS